MVPNLTSVALISYIILNNCHVAYSKDYEYEILTQPISSNQNRERYLELNKKQLKRQQSVADTPLELYLDMEARDDPLSQVSTKHSDTTQNSNMKPLNRKQLRKKAAAEVEAATDPLTISEQQRKDDELLEMMNNNLPNSPIDAANNANTLSETLVTATDTVSLTRFNRFDVKKTKSSKHGKGAKSGKGGKSKSRKSTAKSSKQPTPVSKISFNSIMANSMHMICMNIASIYLIDD